MNLAWNASLSPKSTSKRNNRRNLGITRENGLFCSIGDQWQVSPSNILTLGDVEVRTLALHVGRVGVGSVTGDKNGGSGLEGGQEAEGPLLKGGDGHKRGGSVLPEVVDSDSVTGVGVASGRGQRLGGLCNSAVERHLEGVTGDGGGGEFSGESEHFCV